jgi:hypothetical protein
VAFAASRQAPRAARRVPPSSAAGSRSCAAAGPNTVPPLRQSGLRISPTRARPVPFCRHGFLPLPLTMRAVLRLVRAAALAALACTTDSHIRSRSRGRRTPRRDVDGADLLVLAVRLRPVA